MPSQIRKIALCDELRCDITQLGETATPYGLIPRLVLYNIFMPRMVKCVKLGRELPGLDEPPFDTELGQKIYENVSAEAWRMWAEHSKMLLNEYRLQPWKPEAQQFLVEQMQQYFFGAGAQLPKEYVPPPK